MEFEKFFIFYFTLFFIFILGKQVWQNKVPMVPLMLFLFSKGLDINNL